MTDLWRRRGGLVGVGGDCDAAGIVYYPNYYRLDGRHDSTPFSRWRSGFDQRSLRADHGAYQNVLGGTPLVRHGLHLRRRAGASYGGRAHGDASCPPSGPASAASASALHVRPRRRPDRKWATRAAGLSVRTDGGRGGHREGRDARRHPHSPSPRSRPRGLKRRGRRPAVRRAETLPGGRPPPHARAPTARATARAVVGREGARRRTAESLPRADDRRGGRRHAPSGPRRHRGASLRAHLTVRLHSPRATAARTAPFSPLRSPPPASSAGRKAHTRPGPSLKRLRRDRLRPAPAGGAATKWGTPRRAAASSHAGIARRPPVAARRARAAAMAHSPRRARSTRRAPSAASCTGVPNASPA